MQLHRYGVKFSDFFPRPQAGSRELPVNLASMTVRRPRPIMTPNVGKASFFLLRGGCHGTAHRPARLACVAWGRIVDFAGWDMPVQYTTIVEEHTAVRHRPPGLFDISHMGRLTFTGPDALTLIQCVFTNNAATMKVGQVRYGLVCNDQGGIRDDVLVYRWEDHYSMVVNASNREKIVTWLAEVPRLAPGRSARTRPRTPA